MRITVFSKFPTIIAMSFLGLSACKKEVRDVLPPVPVVIKEFDFAKAADSAQIALNTQFWSVDEKYYNQDNNGNKGFNYWWNAHALDVLVDGYNRTKDNAYTLKMDALLDGMYKKNGNKYLNNFYDDMEWMALACLRAYDATKDVKYKNTAELLWLNIKTGWTSVNGGGIMWEKNSPSSKNACSNGPAIILAVRLYKLNAVKDDLDWAKKIYAWQRQNLVESARGVVWDGYNNFNETSLYTYNQGTWLGGALELYTITNDIQQLNDAVRNTNYVINDASKFSLAGILRGENTGDGGLFKGIFIRYLTQLVILGNVDNYTKATYINYLKLNGESLLGKGTLSPEFIFNPNWNVKPTIPKLDCSVQLSGIMLLESINELKRLNIMK
ncbi:MAG: glycoside hydrolase family 76 [Ferruginibacter sp.]|nr:glycoside hydrolase family 76 [Ferruginibacter sp.]